MSGENFGMPPRSILYVRFSSNYGRIAEHAYLDILMIDLCDLFLTCPLQHLLFINDAATLHDEHISVIEQLV